MLKELFIKGERAFRLVALLWWIFLVDQMIFYITGYTITNLGLSPRTAKGLIGIFTMPFLHGGFLHLLSNSLSLLLLLFLLYLEFPVKHVNQAIVKISISGGILLWMFGRGDAVHIGASVLVYGLMSYTVIAGFIHRRASLIGYSVALIFFNGGSFLAGVLPIDPRISWEGHLMGAIAGVIIASTERESDVRCQKRPSSTDRPNEKAA